MLIYAMESACMMVRKSAYTNAINGVDKMAISFMGI